MAKPHGLRGETVVSLVSDYPELRLAPGCHLWAGDRELVVEASRAHQDRWLVRFIGVVDRTGAEHLAGRALTADPIDDPDALWVHELIGSRVVEAGSGFERGRVVAVVANPAHDLLELDTGHLVPIVFVQSCEEGVTLVAAPEGLFDPAG